MFLNERLCTKCDVRNLQLPPNVREKLFVIFENVSYRLSVEKNDVFKPMTYLKVRVKLQESSKEV